MKSLLLFVVALVSFVQPVFAEYYEREGNYLYKVTKYTELWSTSEGVKMTAQVAHQAMAGMLDSMIKSRILPEAVLNKSDLEAFRKTQSDMDDLVEYLNDFIKEQRARGDKFEFMDVAPDAVIIFAGPKLSLNFGGGIGGSVLLGSVLMPVRVQKIDVRTNKVVEEYTTLRASTIAWPTADAGIAVGGGYRNRVGFGAVWDLNHAMVRPEEFYGAGLGASWSPVTLGVGVNVKAGVLANWDMPGWIDFAYAAISIEGGPAAELGLPRGNVTTIVKASSLMGIFEKSSEDAYKSAMRAFQRTLDEKMRNNTKKPVKDEDEDGEVKPPEHPEKRRS